MQPHPNQGIIQKTNTDMCPNLHVIGRTLRTSRVRLIALQIRKTRVKMLPFAIKYPKEQANGYWGAPSSTIDWCEENYVVSPYIAEAVNTVTNGGFIFLALYAIYSALKNGHEKRFIFMALGFCLVGVGLWLFHMTLRYEYQLLDELPMIYATCIPFWLVFSEFQSKKTLAIVGVGIFSAANILTAIYLHVKNPTLHQAAYAILNAGIIIKLVILTNTHVKDPKARANLMKMMVQGIVTFLTGYFLWNLDIHLCGFFRKTRRSWGMPYGFLLEGHGWWHILTGTGVYYYLVFEEYLRSFLKGTDEFFEVGHVFGFLPEVVCINPKGLKHAEENIVLAQEDAEFLADEKKRQ